MKPAAFDYVKPSDVHGAISVLRESPHAKIMAGSQSLGPMLNLRLVQPRVLVDIAGLPELACVRADPDGVWIGACVTASRIEDAEGGLSSFPFLSRVAAGIAYRAVRNRGTIGGSLCHADPAADWMSALPALGAICAIRGPDGSVRNAPAAEFMTSAFETQIGDSEILEGVFVPRASRAARFGYHKICRKAGKFALAIGAVLRDPETKVFRAVIGAMSGPPIVIDDAAELFDGSFDPRSLNRAQVVERLKGAGLSDVIGQQLHLAALQRAAGEALSR